MLLRAILVVIHLIAAHMGPAQLKEELLVAFVLWYIRRYLEAAPVQLWRTSEP